MENLYGAVVFIVLFVWSNHVSWIMCHREKKSYRRLNDFNQPIPCIVGETCVQVPVDSCGDGCECIVGTPRPGITNSGSCTELEAKEEEEEVVIIEIPYTCSGVPCVQEPEDSCDDGCKCTVVTPRPGITINDFSWPGTTNTDLFCTEIVVEEEEEEEIVQGENACYGVTCVQEPEDSCDEGCECTLVTPTPGNTNTDFSCTLI